MDHKKALALRMVLRIIIICGMVYSHFLGKLDPTIYWYGQTFSRDIIQTAILWGAILLFMLIIWFDVVNEEVHYRIQELEEELKRLKRS